MGKLADYLEPYLIDHGYKGDFSLARIPVYYKQGYRVGAWFRRIIRRIKR